MTRRVFLHVGTPKSGTSYLQDRLALNRDLIESQDIDYLDTRTGDHFEAALDLIGERWAGEEKKAHGQWDALVGSAHKHRGTVVVSHEILAAAEPDAVARAMADFADDEVHVVVTARDLGRQIPAEWQERVKHRGSRAYGSFVDAVVRNHGRTDWQMWFWRVQDLPSILSRWGAHVPPERVHLVTVPSGQGTALWDRFSAVIGLDPRASYAESATTNASLGGPEVTLLRRLNSALADLEVPRATYVEWVRELIVKDVLAQRPGMRRASVPPDRREFVDGVSAEWQQWLGSSGVHVAGDLEDLRPRWPDDADGWPDPDAADADAVAEAAVDALARVLAKVGEDDPGPLGPLARFTWRFRT